MTALHQAAAWIEALPFAMAIAESNWLFPTIEVVHVVALTLVVGSIAMLDLRLLGVSRKDYGVMELAAETLPWTWGAFAAALVSGFLMFTSAATSYIDNVPFRIKLLLIAFAGVNMAVFHVSAYRTAHRWNHELPTPLAARIAGTLSLTFWIGVIFFGRWIGFV
ncbi:MAG TPA: DUF6644 family protein [Steroidobacteraceae bacterium]|nr:DUF6644 family protein [Steroidobacteraceae bacterium]